MKPTSMSDPLTILSSRLTRKDHFLIAGITAFYALISSFFVLRGFGEVDAVKFAVHAFEWHAFGAPAYLSYLFRTSILYLQYLQTALATGLPAVHLDAFMNWTNMAAGSLSCIPLFYLWRRFTSAENCILYFLVLLFVPAFWLGRIYGMPHIPGLLFLFTSFLCFDLFLCGLSRFRIVFLVIAFICSILTVGLKADLLLCFGVFPGLVFLRSRRPLRDLMVAALIPILSLTLIVIYQTSLFHDLSNVFRFSHEWNSHFPFTLQALWDIENITSSVLTLGIVLSLAVMMAVLYGVIRKKHLDVLFWVLCWSVPLASFWGFKMGNSSRHMIAAFIPLLFYAVLILKKIVPRFQYRLSFVCFVILLNYFICPGTQLPRTVRPSSRIFESPAHIQKFIDRWHTLGRTFASDMSKQRIIAGNDYISYAAWESLVIQSVSAHDVDFNASEIPVFKTYYSENVDREKIKALYPEWTIWVWVSHDNNTEFDLEVFRPPFQ